MYACGVVDPLRHGYLLDAASVHSTCSRSGPASSALVAASRSSRGTPAINAYLTRLWRQRCERLVRSVVLGLLLQLVSSCTGLVVIEEPLTDVVTSMSADGLEIWCAEAPIDGQRSDYFCAFVGADPGAPEYVRILGVASVPVLSVHRALMGGTDTTPCMTPIVPLGRRIFEVGLDARQPLQTFHTGLTSWPESCAGYLVDVTDLSNKDRPTQPWQTDVLEKGSIPRRRRSVLTACEADGVNCLRFVWYVSTGSVNTNRA